MSFTPRTDSNFQADLVNFIVINEEYRSDVYLDSRDIPTTGIGYALLTKNNQGIFVIPNYFPDEFLQTTGFQITPTITAGLQSIANALNAGVFAELTPDEVNALSQIPSLSPAQAAGLLNFSVGRAKDNLLAKLTSTLPSNAPRDAQTIVNSLQGTYEYVALIDMTLNSPALIGRNLAMALSTQDRAEAWYEIRYNSNKDALSATPPADAGELAKRRYADSQFFGLYDNSSNVQLPEAKQVYRMLQLHRSNIQAYEDKYGNQIGSANIAFSQAGMAMEVPSLVNSLVPAEAALFADLRSQYSSLSTLDYNDYTSTNIYLDPGRDLETESVDPNHSAVLNARELVNGVEQSVNNILIGEGGNDVLIGGMGDDILIGGDGNDDYRWSTGDGNDKIIDQGPGNRIFINSVSRGDLFAGGYFQKINDTTWQSADGFLTLTHNSPWNLITADGGQIDLGDTLNSGDFGMFLDDAPTAITPARDIIGDLTPIDFDPPNQSYQTDDLGNLIVDPSVAAPGRHDRLRDSTGSDHILSGGGSDQIDFDSTTVGQGLGSNARGGNDWIQAGDGRDVVFSGSGNDLIEGGAGGTEAQLGDHTIVTTSYAGDLLLGGAGDDRIFGDSQIDLAAAIAAGNTQLASGLKGDWLSGQAGDDILVTGADDDFLTGGSGADLLIAGAGDDNIIGDANWVVEDFGWFYHDEPAAPGERTGTRVFEFVLGELNPLDGGGDTIYAGAGNDWIRGGRGDDVVYGEGGNDELRRGKSTSEVAQILGRSEHTVKNQMRNIYGKLGARNRVQALQRATEIWGAE